MLLAALLLVWGLRGTPRPAVTLSLEEKAWLSAHGPLRYAADPAYPPFEWFDNQGVHRGLTADLFALLRERLQVPIEVVQYRDWAQVLERAKTGEVDGLTATVPTLERSTWLTWSSPIAEIAEVVLVRQDEPGNPTLAMLSGRTLAMADGASMAEEVRANYPEIRIVLFKDNPSVIREVSFKQADAGLATLAEASYLIPKEGISNLKVSSDYGRVATLAIGTRRDRPVAASIIAKGVAAVSLTEREELRERWVHLEVGDPAFRRRAFVGLALTAALAALIAGAALFWNASLRHKVAAATAGLQSQLEDRRRTEEALLRAQRLESLSVLAGGIAHDFNNLLTGILGNVSLARMETSLPGDLEVLLQEAEAAALRAVSLTRQLLTFSKGDVAVTQVVNLAPLVQEAALFAARGSAATCRCSAAPGLWPAKADAGQIGQVVQNLVINAVEAMPGGGTIDLELDNAKPGEVPATLAPGSYVRLRVRDSGEGIAPDLLSRIFDPFVSTKRRGSGLGLAVTHSVVTRHRGAIDVRSRPGAGTTFEVLLPAEPAAPIPVKSAPEPLRRRRGRVLVMDDEESVRLVAQRVLGTVGCEVSVAADGVEAIMLWKAARDGGRPFDVVVVDLTVPGGSGGVEVLRLLRQIDPAAKVVISSGYADPADLASLSAQGFTAVLTKPYTAKEAQAVLTPLLPEAEILPSA